MRYIFIFILCVNFQLNVVCQNVAIGTASPNAAALLDLTSTSKGLLPPRMNSSQRQAIASPPAGLLVYDTSTDTYWFFENGKWNELIASNKLAYQLPSNRINPTGDADHLFGFSVCLGNIGTEGLVGSPGANNGAGVCHRMAYADNNLWTISSQNPAGLQPGDQYGYAVAMDRINNSNDAVVSAPFDDSSTVTDMGAVYFFRGTAFKSKAYAPLAGRLAAAKFGRSVDIAGNSALGNAFAIIGAPGANTNRGAAYIYQHNPNTDTWDFEATLTDNNGAAADSFGLAVSLYYSVAGDTAWAFIGAPYDDENAVVDLGSVTVYRKTAGSAVWTRVAKIVPVDTDDIRFGYAIQNVMRCGRVLIGAPFKNTGIGVTYDAELTGISGSIASFELATLLNPAGGGVSTPGNGFKISAMPSSPSSCNEIYATVGSFSGIISSNTGANFGLAVLYRFANNSWTVVDKLTDPDVETTGYGFGRAVSIHTNSKFILIGSPNQTVEGLQNRGKYNSESYLFKY
jgi:hypothetical protein